MGTVLVLARETPYPPNAGDRVVTHGFIRGLAEQRHAIHVVAYGDESDRERAEALTKHCQSVRLVLRAKSDLPPRLRKLRNYMAGRSDVMAMFESPSLVTATRERIRELSPDAVLAEHPYIGQVFRDSTVRRAAENAGTTLVTNAHVVEFSVHRRYRSLSTTLETRAELTLETPRLRQEELAVYEASDRVLVLGSEDHMELSEADVSTPITTQHVALDPNEYQAAPRSSSESTEGVPEGTPDTVTTIADGSNGGSKQLDSTDLLFVGSYGWFPNEDAVTTFAEMAWPRIHAECSDARFIVAGRDAPASVRVLDDHSGIKFVGEIPDLGRAVRDAGAVVAPLRIGGGTRLKVLESMAWGAPVVTTTAGFEGVDARPNVDVAVADDWDEFADRTIEVLNSSERQARLGRNARRRIEQIYALETATEELVANLELIE